MSDQHEDPDDEFEISKLTAAQKRQLKKAREIMAQVAAPRLDAFLAIAERAREAAAKQFASPQYRESRDAVRRFATVNSDLMSATDRMQFSKMSVQLASRVDFGLGDSVSKLTQQFAARQAEFLKNLGPAFEAMQFSFFPPNLRGIEGLRFGDVEKVVMADGIALYGVPRSSIAESLIRADNAAARRTILGSRWKAISADCRLALTGCKTDEVTQYLTSGFAALDALDAGHEQAAQALTASLIDTLVNGYFGPDRYKYTPNRNGTRTASAYEDFPVREHIAMAPIWQAYQQFDPNVGDPIPTTFSRHATIHTVSKRQYTRRNAVQGLMIASSLIYFLDEQASR